MSEEARQDFEAWISAPPYERPIDRYPQDPTLASWPGNYRSYWVQLAWEAWQEAWNRRTEKVMSDLEKRVHNLEVALMAILVEMSDNGTPPQIAMARSLSNELWDTSGEMGAFDQTMMRGPDRDN